jgi:hypothetical protein
LFPVVDVSQVTLTDMTAAKAAVGDASGGVRGWGATLFGKYGWEQNISLPFLE